MMRRAMARTSLHKRIARSEMSMRSRNKFD
jgi:hypothetical protein